MKKSIITNNMACCYVCGKPRQAIHHIFMGNPLRKISDANGFTVPLCYHHHNGSAEGVHFNRQLDLRFKRLCQKIFERTHSREEFIKLIGRNYLEE